jgi:hypothetical protein
MRGRRAALGPADSHGGGVEVDLVPTEVDQLGDPEAMPVRDQDHGGVAVAIAIMAAFISFSISPSVKYSRLRSSVLGLRRGGTVRFTMVGAPSRRGDFASVCRYPRRS